MALTESIISALMALSFNVSCEQYMIQKEPPKYTESCRIVDQGEMSLKVAEITKNTRFRFILPDSVVTMDFDMDRINLHITKEGKVTQVTQG